MRSISESRPEQGRSDWLWRVTAVVVAIILWMVARETHLRTFIVPIHVQNGPARADVSIDPEMVTLRVRGDHTTLNNVTLDDIHAFVDLHGQANRPSAPILVSLPTDVAVTEIAPPSVQIRLKGAVPPH